MSNSSYQIIIDNRERELKKFFFSYPNVCFENLDLGDIIFKFKGETFLLIERKTISDLMASIKDGRYREQKIRILSNFPASQVLYLIEGEKINKRDRESKTIWGSIVSITVREQIRIIRTVDTDESIQFIDRIYQRLSKQPNRLLPKIQQEHEDNNNDIKKVDIAYTSSIKIKKKENLTPQRCNILQLCQIPGVSPTIANVILNHYGSLYNLFKEYLKLNVTEETEETDNNKANMIADITYDIINGKKRRIGNKVSERVYRYLCYLDI